MIDHRTSSLAEFASEWSLEAVPPDVLKLLGVLIADSLAAGVIGSRRSWWRAAAGMMTELGGNADSPVIGHTWYLDVSRAAMLNGTAIGGFEFDHVISGTHPGASVFPAVFAIAHRCRSDGAAMLTALGVGYEISARVAKALTPAAERQRGFHVPAISGILGSAAACARLLGSSVAEIRSAIGIAASSAGGLMAYTRTGAEVKRVHLGRAAQLGLEAAMLARQGMTGPPDVLDCEFGVLQAFSPDPNRQELIRDLGATWLTRNSLVKLYPAHGVAQPFIPALECLRQESHGAVEDIVVRGQSDAVADNHDCSDPASLLAAQSSIPFVTGVVLLRGADALDGLDEDTLSDAGVLELARQVHVEALPAESGKTITVGGELTWKVDGSSKRLPVPGLSVQDPDSTRRLVAAKLARVAGGSAEPTWAQRVLRAVDRVSGVKDLSELAGVISSAPAAGS